jgi:hypothetical protein
MSKTSKQFVICVNNESYSASLEKRKIYVALGCRMIRAPMSDRDLL